MNHKCLQFLLVFCLIVSVYARVNNGDFEEGVVLIEQSYPGYEDFNAPLGWDRERYAAVVDNFVPDPVLGQGNYDYWLIDTEIGLLPYSNQFFVVLSTGDFYPNEQVSQIWQKVCVNSGDRISGVYFFGTCDYPRFDDYATITLIPDSNAGLEELELVRISASNVGQFSSIAGWERFEHTFSPAEAGTYNLVLFVTDLVDEIYESYLAVDDITICAAPEYGDLNYDCWVNMTDFSLFAQDWLQDCSDPSYLAEPKNNCSYGTNIDTDGLVDANDLYLMSQFWLNGDYSMICAAPEYGDLDHDCRVNMTDFLLFAQDWLQDCSEPNNSCSYGTDIDENGLVDANDFYLMSQFWLNDEYSN